MNARIIKCFIASPSDTVEERRVCDEVFTSINKELGDQYQFRIESIKWENDAVPALGKDGQDVINTQLSPGEHDFYIGILKHKFGSPTPRAGSGTEEEFYQALEHNKQYKTPEIQVYFSTEPVPQEIAIEDFQKVKDFKQRVSNLGCFYQSYSGIEDFKGKLRKNLTKKIIEMQKDALPSDIVTANDLVKTVLENKFNSSLELFDGQNVIWIERYICRIESFVNNFDDCLEQALKVDELLTHERSCVIKAPPQFGLTSLSRWLVLQAWIQFNEAWLYLDFDNLNVQKIDKIIEQERQIFRKNFTCVILDSWAINKPNCQKIFQIIAKTLPNIRLIVMQTDYSSTEYLNSAAMRLSDMFIFYQLMPLPKKDLRQAVAHYSSHLKYEEDIVLNRLVTDFDSLNIHRTPMNCWTLLKVAESNFDKNPINRTDMLEAVLFALFSLCDLPQYSVRPDIKDCEQILGDFCSKLIINEIIYFTVEDFLTFSSNFCKQQLLNVDTNALWKVLYNNHIITTSYTDNKCRFKSSFWIYFFAAKQMERDKSFYDYIFSNNRYAKYPEIIEFFTGIKRDRSDVLTRLSQDLRNTKEVLQQKIGLGKGVFCPLTCLQWRPTDSDVKKLKQTLSEKVIHSSVPQEIKDQHADSTYNHIAPYNQDINVFLTESSFITFLWQLKALSRALRNSDYASPDLRKNILAQIITSWSEISKVLFVLAPILTQHGQAMFEGFSFYLSHDFSAIFGDKDKLFNQILEANPHNVVRIVKDDLASERLSLLFEDFLSTIRNPLIEHLAIIYLICERPDSWYKLVEKSINGLNKNSFYLLNIYRQLQYVYAYDYMSSEDETRFIRLMKCCLAKHDSISLASNNSSYYSGIVKKSIPERKEENLRDL